MPSRVQGAGAAEELAAVLELAARIRPAVDAIALVRGGGSLEDLWAFNEEVLVRAVAASPIPVVSGVGHEIDVSLADLAADLRALTPTDAAVRLSPDRVQLAAQIDGLAVRMRAGLLRRVEMARDRVGQLGRSRILADPGRLVRDRRSTLEQHAGRLQRLSAAALDRSRERLAAAAGRLDAGSPLRLLSRGYSVCWLEGGPPAPADERRALRSIAGVDAGATLVTQLTDGRLLSRVERISPDAG